MKLALIPPISRLNDLHQTDYQLMLPHLIGIPAYAKAYKDAQERGDYIILDNGIAEGLNYEGWALAAMAKRVHASELVLPDEIANRVETIRKTEHAFYTLPHRRTFRLMGVVQGTTLRDCFECIRSLVQFPINTLGIPRHLESTVEHGTRHRLAHYIKDTFGTAFAIHLLGTNPDFIHELRTFGGPYHVIGVRGVDTSAPYNYGHANHLVSESQLAISRPDNYFHLGMTEYPEAIDKNITIMRRWVEGAKVPLSGQM